MILNITANYHHQSVPICASYFNMKNLWYMRNLHNTHYS